MWSNRVQTEMVPLTQGITKIETIKYGDQLLSPQKIQRVTSNVKIFEKKEK